MVERLPDVNVDPGSNPHPDIALDGSVYILSEHFIIIIPSHAHILQHLIQRQNLVWITDEVYGMSQNVCPASTRRQAVVDLYVACSHVAPPQSYHRQLFSSSSFNATYQRCAAGETTDTQSCWKPETLCPSHAHTCTHTHRASEAADWSLGGPMGELGARWHGLIHPLVWQM